MPTDETNLAWRAAVAVAELGGVDQPVAIHIDKNIPVAGGMAGGSADAAASVLACNALWEVGLDRSEMLTICADLGSDVPFCLSGGVAVGRGRGEQLVPVLSRGTFHFVFAASETGPVSYTHLDVYKRQGLDLTISNPKQVTLDVAGVKKVVSTNDLTVTDLLAANAVTLGTLDTVVPAANTPLTTGMAIVVTRVSQKTETVTESIGYAVTKVNDSSMY